MNQTFHSHLQVSNIALSRGNDPLLDGLTFDAAPGQAVWLTGANGIGKTSLLLALAGLIPLDAGQISWRSGDQIMRPSACVAFSAFRGPERDGLTLGEELAFWQRAARDTVSLDERLHAVGLSGRAHTPVAGLSAGQRRRLSLARLHLSGRAAWLMDEPLAGLDAEGRTRVTDSLATHLNAGGIALIASHQPIAIPGVDARKLVLEATA